jgi:hypothetical protein
MKTATKPTMEITTIQDGSEYSVKSSSGNSYTVQYAGSGDGDPDYCSLWECDCPAGQHGKLCKHVNAVIDFIDSEDEDY